VFVLGAADALPHLASRETYFDGRRALIQVVAP
jgi:hypothetical protein